MTCDTKCSLAEVFTFLDDLWHSKKMFIWASVHSFLRTNYCRWKFFYFGGFSASVHNRPWRVTMYSSVQFTRPCDPWREHLVEIVQYVGSDEKWEAQIVVVRGWLVYEYARLGWVGKHVNFLEDIIQVSRLQYVGSESKMRFRDCWADLLVVARRLGDDLETDSL